ncbi:indole-3-glycerol-phosphate synthase [Alteromonas sp. a30]|nr:indole-3-glycerol-phosphate synthase [Alteromonas sp. a30]
MESNMLKRILEVKSQDLIPVLAEVKPSSPNKGDLLRNRSVADITRAYVEGGAACLSIVTGRWFGGNIGMLAEMAEVAKESGIPVLRKDLIVNKEQLKESKANGANAVLLTTKILQAQHLEKLVLACVDMDMTPFIEVATPKEIEQLPSHNAIVLGITNRDIGQKEMDVDSGLKGISLIESVKGKAGAIISASGISTNAEANLLMRVGFDGLLVGTSLLEAEDPTQAVRDLSKVRVASE